MIKNIIFDLSEVIISGYAGIEKIIERKYKISENEFNKKRIAMNDMFLELMRGKIIEDEYVKKLLDETKWNISIKDMKDAIRENLNIPVDGTMEVIKKLKGKYKLILLSDHVKEWTEYILENNRQLEIFDEIFFSYKIKKLKSDPGTFNIILDKLNIDAKETIFIDDNPLNVDMAKSQGISGIVFTNAKKLQNELKLKYNILI